MMPEPYSFIRIESHPDMPLVGYTQASRVIPLVRSSEFESEMLTKSLAPSNFNAFPNFPLVTQAGPFFRVPLFELPDASLRVVPVPSSKPYAATSPGIAAKEIALVLPVIRCAEGTSCSKTRIDTSNFCTILCTSLEFNFCPTMTYSIHFWLLRH